MDGYVKSYSDLLLISFSAKREFLEGKNKGQNPGSLILFWCDHFPQFLSEDADKCHLYFFLKKCYDDIQSLEPLNIYIVMNHVLRIRMVR